MRTSLSILRIFLSVIFLWAFFDKVFGLGFSTIPSNSWLTGTSPTAGFLKTATHGPLKTLFVALSGNSLVDWLFMLGLLFIGLGLLLGIARKLTTYSGTLLLLLMWISLFPPKTNPFIDEHIIYILVLWVLYKNNAGGYWGFSKWWDRTKIVKSFPVLS